MGEPIEIYRREGLPHRRLCRWRHSAGAAWAITHVCVGTVEDGTGRWFVDRAGPDADTTAWPDEEAALEEVGRLMALHDGEWEQVPCYPTQGWRDGERDR